MAPSATPRPRRPPEEHLEENERTQQNENVQTAAKTLYQPPRPTPKNVCTNPDCANPKPVEIDGERVCETCGSIISQDNIVAEVTFGETSAGAAVVQGGYIGEGQRHAKTHGASINRKVGGGLTSREQTHQHFQQEIARIASSLGLQQSVKDGAFNYMKLALINNFTYGRSTSTVAAVALYLACRTDKENNTLLMDLAEAVKTNVYKLGQTYQELAKMLYMDGGVKKDDITPFVEVERLVLKYARRLEFGAHTYKVAEDAAKIIKRMKRDWMVTGRRPAGLCGASLILAARMNNFRRTVREVVYVVKVADMTIAKRLDEFDRTTSGALTVEQFRQYGPNLKIAHDPPVLFETKIKEEKKLTSRSASAANPRPTTSTPAPTQEPRRDGEGFAIPAIPLDPRLASESVQNSSNTQTRQASTRGRKRKRRADSQDTQESTSGADSGSDFTPGPPSRASTAEPSTEPPQKRKRRYRKRERPEPIQIAPADLAAGEAELENEIHRHLHSSDFLTSMEEVRFLKYTEAARRLARALNPSPSPNPNNNNNNTNGASAHSPIPDSEVIGEDEFASDPEVEHCLLSERECEIKERIWVTHNEDWLRAQQARILRRALAEAEARKGRRAKGKRPYRRGDGSSAMKGGTPAESPAEASQRMLERYGNKGYSRHINYERLNQIYRGSGKRKRGGDGSSVSGGGQATGGAPEEVMVIADDEEIVDEELRRELEEEEEVLVEDDDEDVGDAIREEDIDMGEDDMDGWTQYVGDDNVDEDF
ncbi:hypothetical protein EV356DRAFT_482712 [Viridothelium virens]|uniref:Cyclin-like domain-containing protein n=1 Tax=Viridothelium virens TaxID=1048519 RepID=A0A6A6HE11_VIRVR|nr:hypothetical protein EV356DRAFT_482712 [Viridothelium virens]